MLFILAWRNLWRNKRRTAITLASIGFATFFASFYTSLTEGAYHQMVEGTVGQSLGYVQIHQKGYWDERTLDNSFVYSDELSTQVDLALKDYEVIPRLESFALASHGDRAKAVMIMGVVAALENSITQLSDKVQSGTLFSHPSSVVLGQSLAEYLGLAVGDSIQLAGKGIDQRDVLAQYSVAGILKLGSPELDKQLLYMPLPLTQQFFQAPNRITSLTVDLKANDPISEVQTSLVTTLDAAAYEVMNWEELAPEVAQSIDLSRASREVVIYVLYIIIAFGIFGTFLMMTKERQYEFGVTIAIGMHRHQLMRIVMFEILFLALMGAALGVILALPLTGYLAQHPIVFTGEQAKMYEDFGQEPILAFAFTPALFVKQAITVAIISLILAIYPMWSISRTQVVEAMRA